MGALCLVWTPSVWEVGSVSLDDCLLQLPCLLPFLWEWVVDWVADVSVRPCATFSLHVGGVFAKVLPLQIGILVTVSQPHFGQVWGWNSHSQSWGLGVLWDSRMFRAQQQGEKHLVLGCSWCHWVYKCTSFLVYKFGSDLVPIGGRGEELRSLKVPGVQIGTVSGLHFGSPGKKCHSGASAAEWHKEYYREDGGDTSRVRAVVCLVSPS